MKHHHAFKKTDDDFVYEGFCFVSVTYFLFELLSSQERAFFCDFLFTSSDNRPLIVNSISLPATKSGIHRNLSAVANYGGPFFAFMIRFNSLK